MEPLDKDRKSMNETSVVVCTVCGEVRNHTLPPTTCSENPERHDWKAEIR